MYAAHFGLKALPFENVPDPAFFFNEGEYQRVLRRLSDAVGAGRGLMVVAGPIGSGKTTLSQKLMADLPGETVHLWSAEPPETDQELFRMLLERLGATFAWESRVLALGVLRDRLLRLRSAGGRCLLVVDESHKFSDGGLEAVRLLNNLEQGPDKLIQVLLLGQEELTGMLTSPGREAFRQRIANLEILGRMTPPQVRDYVRHRLRVAGGDPGIFPDLVLEAVAEAAGGIPRLTNSLCDRALLHAFEHGKPVVDGKDLLHAAEEIGVYRKAFHFLVGRERAAEQGGDRPAKPPEAAPAPVPASAPAPAATAPAPAALFPVPAAPAPAARAVPADAPARGLNGPLLVLAGGVVALAASLVFYGSRAAALGGDWLSRLVQDLVR
jgi:general secretion pathway protein A